MTRMHETIRSDTQPARERVKATQAANPFALEGLNPVLKILLHRLAKVSVLRDWYDDWSCVRDNGDKAPDSPVAARFLDYALGKLGTTLTINNPERAAELPKEGPLLVVANHPLGAIEGMLLSQWLLRLRPDLKVMVNQVLLSLPEFQSLFIGVDVLQHGQQRRNALGLRAADRHLKQNGALLLFPAGTVSRLNPRTGQIDDAPWNTLAGYLALRHRAMVLPVHVQGKNPMWFYWAGIVNKRLRTALLPRAMLARQGQTVAVTLGPVVAAADDQPGITASSLTQRLRVSCELLDPAGSGHTAPSKDQAVAHARPDLASSMALMSAFKVAGQGELAVYLAPYQQLGDIADHLAIERERCFRAAGEGTGKSRDVDRFDPHYWHIWGWDETNRKITGGYRLAEVSQVLRGQGLTGLYSHALFDYDQTFLTALGNSVEVGRSFVTEDYQRNPRALDLLWRGIGAFINQHPQVHTLFGCVSISGRYVPVARALLADSLLAHHRADRPLQRLIRPRSPLQFTRTLWTDDLISTLSHASAVNALLDHCPTERRMPTLIRHYLNLNGKFLSFTVNHGFNQSLDGLIMVDLRQTPERYLNRYLGRSGAERFRLTHNAILTQGKRYVA